MKKSTLLLTLAASFLLPLTAIHAAVSEKVEANRVKEISLVSSKPYANPFMEVELDAVVTRPDGKQLRVPAFWAGGNDWKFRYASELAGTHSWKTECKDASNTGLHGISGTIEIIPSTSDNPLYKHGPVRVSENKRHFEHADGTPFFWLADTWWKNLCKRMTWEGFQELAADRRKKGFNAIHIVCGPYPDEGFLEERMANEGGLPYESVKFEKVNPEYFNYADRRIQHLVESGLAPVIVGSWGRGDCNSMQAIGLEGLKRHWRYLVARYGAYPIFWILAGEVPDQTKWNEGPWAPLAKHAKALDPFQRPLTCHTGHGRRGAKEDTTAIDFDMVGGNHDQNAAIQPQTVAIVSSAYSKEPPMPVLVGETCYEGHMQQGFGDTQRRMFWQSILNGAAGHTYGAAGIWHASVEGDPGCASAAFGGKKVYDWTTWKEGMNYPGATELGMAKKLLEQYPWQRFEPHPEWTSPNGYAAGIPGEVRFIYHPRGRIYDWTGTVVKELEPGVSYSVFYFDPATGRRFDQGIIQSETGEFKMPELPSPQDWVLVLQAQNRAKTVTLPALKVGETCSGKLEPIGATFTKKSGPDWLTVQSDGTYSGTPKDMNAGRNSILVSVKQPDGEELVLQVRIQVLGADGEVFLESFGAYEGTKNNKQADTGLTVAHGGKIAGWSSSGAGTVHAVDRSMRTSETALTPSDWAIMIFKDNVITSSEISANASGKSYEVSFETAPAAYGDLSQATKAGDALLIEVLRKDGIVLKSFEHTPGAWSGKSAFTSVKFSYQGDDSGDIRLRISAAGSKTDDRFKGAIDNLAVQETK
jgi:hypothetical protein